MEVGRGPYQRLQALARRPSIPCRSQMPVVKLSPFLAKLILELDSQQKDPAEIAQILNLKKILVSTILAYRKSQEAKATEVLANEVLPQADVRIPEESPSASQTNVEAE